MKLATLKNGQRDGILVVVDRKLETCTRVPQIARNSATGDKVVERDRSKTSDSLRSA